MAFKVKVEGHYVARSGVMDKERIRKNYEIEGVIPTTVAALSIVKNKLLAPALAAKYPDYVTFLTYHITEITPMDEASQRAMGRVEVNYMGREALLHYIKENALAVDARYYPDLFKLREAVSMAKNDPEGYAKQFEAREADLRLDLEIAACNPTLFGNTPSPEPLIASANLSSRKASSTKVLAKQTGDRLAGLAADQIRDGEMAPVDDEEHGELTEDLDL